MNGYYELLPFKGSHYKTPGGIKLSKEAVPADLCQSLVFLFIKLHFSKYFDTTQAKVLFRCTDKVKKIKW